MMMFYLLKTRSLRPCVLVAGGALSAALLCGCQTVERKLDASMPNRGVLIERVEAAPATPSASAAVSIIRPDLDCKVPEENFDVTVTLQQRLGAEGAARLKTLLSSDFKDSSVSPADRELLRKFSREVVWMPVQVEQWIGNVLFFTGKSNFEPLPRNDFSEPEWDQAIKSMGRLLGVAPKVPFDIRLMVIRNGETGSLAGGLVVLDERTISGSASNPAQANKLNFIAAHELAHVYKRHRAKRIQQLLVDSDSGLALMRKSLDLLNQKGNQLSDVTSAFKFWVEALSLSSGQIDALRKQNAKYEQDQEFEADMCATAMLLKSAVGDPLSGFMAYRKDQQEPASGSNANANANASAVYESHPPNAEREQRIRSRVLASAAPAPAAPVRRPGAPAAVPLPPQRPVAPPKR